ncbi:hypothetical protein OTU49_011816, partial [Cherax quadricarinatus]
LSLVSFKCAHLEVRNYIHGVYTYIRPHNVTGTHCMYYYNYIICEERLFIHRCALRSAEYFPTTSLTHYTSAVTTTTLTLHKYCTTTTLTLHKYCTTTTLTLHKYCTTTTLTLHKYCTTTTLTFYILLASYLYLISIYLYKFICLAS